MVKIEKDVITNMEIARNVAFDGGKVIFSNLSERKILDMLAEEFANAHLTPDGLVIPASSKHEAMEIYVRVASAIRLTPYLEKLGFSYRDIFGYRFLIYLTEYSDGLEREILDNPLSREYEIVTLPDRDGYYCSTLYGIDNINLPAILVLGNLYARELLEVVEANPGLMELLDLKRISGNVLRLERFGEARLAKLAGNLEKIERIEDTVKKMLAVRSAISHEVAVAGDVEHDEVQKIRRLGNGLCVYLSKNLRDMLGIKEGDAVSVRVISGKIFIEKV